MRMLALYRGPWSIYIYPCGLILGSNVCWALHWFISLKGTYNVPFPKRTNVYGPTHAQDPYWADP